VILRDHDTIAAIATPLGEGAIAVIRISGEHAVGTVDEVFRGHAKLQGVPGNTIHFGRVVDAAEKTVDEVLAAVFRSPHSYTGEDSVEISCHGGVFVANRVLETILRAGARQADPGEFTKRRFLKGKIDLSQAEAVADLIHARSEKALWVSIGHLQGRLSTRVSELKSELMHLCSLLEIELDFSEEGISIVARAEVLTRLQKLQRKVADLISSYEIGKRYRDGVLVVLVGKPNSGKSSIFNALLSESRAIVSPTPGTTRDYLEEALSIEGVLFRIVDTAGLREVSGFVESEGVARSKGLLSRADVVVVVLDSTVMSSREEALESVRDRRSDCQVVLAFNKIDLVRGSVARRDLISMEGSSWHEVRLSAKTGEGLDLLTQALVDSVGVGSSETESGLRVTSLRHVEAFRRVDRSIQQSISSHEAGMTSEFVALDVRRAVDALSEVTGEITTDDILNDVFGKFCVGK